MVSRHMVNRQLTDWQRVQLAQLEYYDWEIGDDVLLPDGQLMGTVIQLINTADGFKATVILTHHDEMTLLLRGSSGIRKGDPTTWTNEWLRVNLPVGGAILNRLPNIPQEMWTANQQLNRLLHRYPTKTFFIYGHSLGSSINAQFALANCLFPEQIGGVYLYEGPNIYWLLNNEQRARVLQLRCQIFNYIDPRDVVVLGYLDRQHTIGLVRVIDSTLTNPVSQHMWGGYRFDSQQRLILEDATGPNRRAVIDQHIFNQVERMKRYRELLTNTDR